MAAGKKVVASLVSLFVVVGAVIGVIAVIGRGNEKEGSTFTSAKAVTSMCESTQYKDACSRALSAAATKNESASPKDYLRAIIDSTVDELKKGLEQTLSVKKAIEESKSKTKTKTSMSDRESIMYCEANLKYALEDLDGLIKKTVDETSLDNMGKHAYDLRVWLTMIDVYNDNCVESITNPERKKAVENGLRNSTELTRVAVDIVYNFRDILKALNIPANFDDQDLKARFASSSSRKLLGEMEVDQDGYPAWLHHTDRKLLEAPGGPKPNAVVAKDGSGFKTIKEALATYPKNHQGRFVIYIKAGLYLEENVTVEHHMNNVFMYGDGRGKTIISGRLNADEFNRTGGPQGAEPTSTFSALGTGFLAKSMTFSNAAGPEGKQAVALRIGGDHSAVFDCSIEGHQDTLYYQGGRQFYKNCAIYGTIDFIFGSGICLIQDSDIVVRKPKDGQSNMVTADGKLYPTEATALVLQNCRIMADPFLYPVRHQVATYLGRPWKPFAKTVFMQSQIDDLIKLEGYQGWKENEKTATYLEYANRGPGANTAGRVKWSGVKVIDRNEALQYTASRFLESHFLNYRGPWLQQTGFPFYPEFAA